MSQQSQIGIQDFVNLQVDIGASATPYELFGVPLILGDSTSVTMAERFRTYNSIQAVGNDFSNTSPEFLAAEIFFEQQPQPSTCFIGRWASAAAAGQLYGAILTPTQQALTNFTSIINGSFHINVDGGTAFDITGMNLSGALNLNGVAAIVQTAVQTHFAGVTVVWNANEGSFVVTSHTTGATSNVTFASTLSALGGSTDISHLLGLSALDGGFLSPGVAVETALTAVQACANASTQWYGLAFASTSQPSAADYLAVANYILASSRTRIFGVNILTTDCLTTVITSDIASQLQALNNDRVFWHFSSTVAYPVMTLMGRAFTVDFNGNNTTITLAYKQAPGVPGEYLTETQFSALKAKGGNVVINVNNGATMIWPGQMANGVFFDEVHNIDWFSNKVQTDVFNLLYTTTTKIPETDGGNNVILQTIENSCGAAVNNGMAAAGVWEAAGFGSLQTGMALLNGFYAFAPQIATQSQADRVARKSVTFQIALKLAGAVHLPYVVLNLNR